MIYMLSHADYDTYSPYILEGPEVPDWTEYCNSILDDAGKLALETQECIGWDTLVKFAVKILQTKGYTLLKPPETVWTGGSNILTLDDVERQFNHYGTDVKSPKFDTIDQIMKHNSDVQKKMYLDIILDPIDIVNCIDDDLKGQYDYIFNELTKKHSFHLHTQNTEDCIIKLPIYLAEIFHTFNFNLKHEIPDFSSQNGSVGKINSLKWEFTFSQSQSKNLIVMKYENAEYFIFIDNWPAIADLKKEKNEKK